MLHFGCVSVGERSAATVNERAARFICEVREEPQLYGGTLSFVIRGGDRLSAVVRFGSNMSYVQRPTGCPEFLVGRLGRSVAALTSGDRVVAKKKKGAGGHKESNNNLDNEAMSVDRRRERGRKCAKGAER